MTDQKIADAMRIAEKSLNIEGFTIDVKSRILCEKLLRGEISLEQYIEYAKSSAGLVTNRI